MSRAGKLHFVKRILHSLLAPIWWSAYLSQRLFGSPSERKKRLWESRLQYRYFFQGLPALLAAVAVMFLAGSAWREQYRREQVYADAAHSAYEANDMTTAVLCYERLANLKPDIDHYRYNLGICCEKQGDEARSVALLAPLAPRDRLGYPPAHLWIAARLLRQPQLKTSELQTAEVHFTRLRRDIIGLADAANQGLTEVYARQGRINEIIEDEKLYAVAKQDPRLRLLLAQAAARQGETAKAAAEARELVPGLRRRVDEFPDDQAARIRLVEAYGLAGDERALMLALRKGAELQPGGPFGLMLAEYLTNRAVRVGNSNATTQLEKAAARSDAVKHLDIYGQKSERTQLLAGQLMRLNGDLAEAERRYLALVQRWPPARVELADLYLQAERRDEAEQQWKDYLADLNRRDARDQPLSDEEYVMAAVAARRLGDFPGAERWLAETQPTPENNSARTQLYVSWWDDLIAHNPADGDVELLRKGLRVDPWNTPLLSRLLTAARRNDPPGEAARAMLKEMIVVNDVPATAYSLLGTDAYERGDLETARRYLEQAGRLDPKSAVTLNNLAWTLLTGDTPNPRAALPLAEAAVLLAPTDVHYRDTRFRILVELKQWQQALTDLEFCASTMNGKPEFHRAAAEVYENLKLVDLAAEHRRLAHERRP